MPTTTRSRNQGTATEPRAAQAGPDLSKVANVSLDSIVPVETTRSASVNTGRPGIVEDMSPYAELGRTGLKQVAGFVQEEFLRELQGARGMQAYREMAQNSAVLGAGLRALELPMLQVQWMVEPKVEKAKGEQSGQASAEAIEAAEFVDQCRDDMSCAWDDVVQEALTCIQYGWAFMEVIYKQRNGEVEDESEAAPASSKYDDARIGWRKLSLRAQETLFRWDFDRTGGVRGLFQIAPPDYITRYIPIEKAGLFRTKSTRGNPEGYSFLRNAYMSWYQVKRVMNFEGIGIERDLTGVPVARVPETMLIPNPPPEIAIKVEAMRKAVRDLKNDEQLGILIPSSRDEFGNDRWGLELLSSPGTRQHDTSKVVDRYELRMLQSLLCDFLMLGHQEVGSRALAEPKMEFFELSLNALLAQVAKVFNRYLIPRLLRMNGMNPRVAPTLKHGKVRSENLAQLGELLKVLSDAGMPLFPNPPLQQHLMERAHLPSLPPEEIQEEADERQRELFGQQLKLKGGQDGEDEKDDEEKDDDGKPSEPGRARPGGAPDDDDEEERDAKRESMRKHVHEAIAATRAMKRNGRRVYGSGVLLKQLEALEQQLAEE